jgi:hypothetical protein
MLGCILRGRVLDGGKEIDSGRKKTFLSWSVECYHGFVNRTSHGTGAGGWRGALTCWLLLLVALSPAVNAQNSTNSVSNRWLLVVDTSKAMQRRAASVRQVAAGLVLSGMGGQIRPGDTLGLWTYNDTLHAGVFPLQELEQDNEGIARRVYSFLEQQKFEKASRLEEVLPRLYRIVQSSPYITVVLISDGSGEITGTPFDEKINASYRTWQTEQQKGQMPIVTFLRAKQGKFTEYVINTPPWPLELPPLPEELIAKPKPEPPKPRMAAPLIVSGRKPQVTNAVPVAAAVEPAPTNPVPEAAAAQPAPMTNVAITPAAPPATAPSTMVAEKPKVEIVEPEKKTEVIVAKVEDAAPPPSAAPEQVAAETSASASQGSGTIQNASVTTSGSFLRGKNIWILGASMVVIVFGFIYLRARRVRNSQPISLITRSLDQEK